MKIAIIAYYVSNYVHIKSDNFDKVATRKRKNNKRVLNIIQLNSKHVDETKRIHSQTLILT